jgi:hypothetical protein
MKAYRWVDVQTHAFLTSALVVDDWSPSRPGRFDPGEKHPIALDRRLDGFQNRFGRRGEKKNLSLPGLELRTFGVQPIASRYTDRAIAAS